MKYTEIKYTRRHNTGNYEFEEASLGAVIDEGEDAQEVGAKVKNQVEVFLGLAKPSRESRPTSEPKPEPKEEVKEEVKEEPAPEPEKKTAKKKVTKKKTTKKKPEPSVTYDRSIKVHKDELVNIFDDLRPGWNKDKDLAPVCKGISEQMVGEYIFDSEGKILDSFTKKVEDLLIEGEEEAGGL